jgi:hypothetical protein
VLREYQTLRSSYRSYIKPTAPNARSDTQGPTLRQASFFLPDFCNKIGTWQNTAYRAVCPQLAKADVRPLTMDSGFAE